MKHSISIISIILVVCCCRIAGQEITFERISTKEGLSQNDVLYIFQDSEGLMWFSTNDGVNRYDGYDFEVFRKKSEHSNALSSNLSNAICEDNNKNVWIGTIDNGITVYSLKTRLFTIINNTEAEPNVLTDNQTYSLILNADGSVLSGSYRGINKITELSGGGYEAIKIEHLSGDSLIGKQITNPDFEIINNSLIWMVSQKCLSLLSKTASNRLGYEIKKQIKLDGNHYYRQIKKCNGGFVLCSALGVYFLEIDPNKPEKYKVIQLSNIGASCLEVDSEGKIWAGTSEGLLFFKPSEDETKPYFLAKHIKEGENPENISNNIIRDLFIDRAGIVWVGTSGGGICKYNPNKRQFRKYGRTDQKGSISNNVITEIYEDKDSNVWFGVVKGGLHLLSKENEKRYNDGFVAYEVNVNSKENKVYKVVDISTEKERKLLAGVGFPKKGVFVFPDRTGNIIEAFPEKLPKAVFTVCQTFDSVVWLGTYRGGLYRYNNANQLVRFTTENTGLPSDIIRSLIQDSEGNLWIGTSDGLCVVKANDLGNPNLPMHVFKNIENKTNSLSDNYILPLFESSTGEIWIGTLGGGLNKLIKGAELSESTFERFTVDEGMPNNVIKDIVEDFNGELWISSNLGLTKLNPRTNQIRNYSIADNLQDAEFSEMAGCILHDGEILFGGVNGFNAFYPDELSEDTVPPEIVFTNLEVQNKKIEPGISLYENPLLDIDINSADRLRLNYKENSFTVYFSAIHYTEPQSNQYKYKLVGVDKEWIRTSANMRFARYSNLKPGKYKLEVMASNSDGYWTKQPKSLIINIIPPIWQTWWFIILSLSVLTGTGVIVILWRFRLIRKENYELEEKVRLRTKEIANKNSELRQQAESLNEINVLLEEGQQVIEEQSEELRAQKGKLEEMNETKDKFYSLLAHDLKNPFNILLGYLDLLKMNFDKYTKEKIFKTFGIIYETSNQLYKLTQSLLQWSRAQRGLIPFNPIEIEIEKFVTEDIVLYERMANEKQIEIKQEVDKGLSLVTADKDMLQTVIRNLVSNAIKFTYPNGTIRLKVDKLNESIQFSISDTGIGIEEKTLNNMFKLDKTHSTEGTAKEKGTGLGLMLCKEFINMHGGEIWAESTLGIGSIFYFSIPEIQKGS